MTENIIPVCRPQLPLAEHILPYLKQIDQNRWYTNYGPLVCEFLIRFARLFGLNRSQIISATNGTIMLELCLKAMGIPKDSLCVMPSWTFVATPLAAVNANLEPYFVDVDLETQTINPVTLEHDIAKIEKYKKIGAIIVVTPFGMPVDVAAWDNFTIKTGIPVIIDAAAGFDAALQMPQMKIGNTPIMFSLHATKVMGIGEAAILLSRNEDLISLVECYTQFGFPKGIRNAELHGTNAKISEYVGAVGLAALDVWSETRKSWMEISHCYQTLLSNNEIQHTFSADWVPSTCNIILPEQADNVAAKLEASGIMTRKWYGNGCHKQSVFKNNSSTELTMTEYLAKSVLGLPFYINMGTDTIKYIMDSLISIIEEADEQINAA